MIAAPSREDGRSWLAALLASLVALVVAATMLLGGGDPPRPTALLHPGAATTSAVLDPLASPSPRAPSASSRSERPRWSGKAAASPPTAAESPLPRRMLVPRLGLDLPIVATGVSGDGQMSLPERPTEIGWYRYGPRPGDRAGSTVLAGHLDSRKYGVGPLAAMRKLREGDLITIERERGKQTYQVLQVAQISKRSVPLDELFARSGPATLRIVTCGGPYDRSRGGYRDNLVVTAVPV